MSDRTVRVRCWVRVEGLQEVYFKNPNPRRELTGKEIHDILEYGTYAGEYIDVEWGCWEQAGDYHSIVEIHDEDERTLWE